MSVAFVKKITHEKNHLDPTIFWKCGKVSLTVGEVSTNFSYDKTKKS